MNRRRFLIGLGATLATPALVRVTSLDTLPRGISIGAHQYISQVSTADFVWAVGDVKSAQEKLWRAYSAPSPFLRYAK